MLTSYWFGFCAAMEWWRWALVRMEWRPAGCSVCMPLLIFPCTIKSRSSLLAPAHPGGPEKKGCKTVVLWHCKVDCLMKL